MAMLNLKSFAMTMALASTIACFITACGPVKFSAPSASTSTSNQDGSGNGSGTGTTPPVTPIKTRDVSASIEVKNPSQKVDLLLVLDISNSMLEDNKKLSSRLASFVSKLSTVKGIDWQMCLTVPYDKSVDNTGKITAENLWGRTWGWFNYTAPSPYPSYVLRSGTPYLDNIFTTTIAGMGAGWLYSDDERGIKQVFWHLSKGNYNNPSNNGCYRPDAALSVVLISDEDERSVGGDASQVKITGENKALENDDLPETLVSQVRSLFGESKRFTFNSIIVKDGDTSCKTTQDAQGAPSHYGRSYEKLSQMTGGGVGSICDSDYSTNLNLFFNQILTSLSSVTLECPPYLGNIDVKVTPTMSQAPAISISGNRLNLTPEVPGGSVLSLSYKCVVPN